MAIPSIATILQHSSYQCRFWQKTLRATWLLHSKSFRTSPQSTQQRPHQSSPYGAADKLSLWKKGIFPHQTNLKFCSQVVLTSQSVISGRKFSTSKRSLVNVDKSGQPPLPVFLHAEKYLENVAVVDQSGSFTYSDILHHSMSLAIDVISCYKSLDKQRQTDMKLDSERIALLTDQGVSYVIGQYATWIVNGISVPLCATHPPSEWEYFLRDAQCTLVLASEGFIDKISPIAESLNIPVRCLSMRDFTAEYEENKWFQSDLVSNSR